MRRLAALLILAALFAPSAALGATARVSNAGVLLFAASAGETNQVELTRVAGGPVTIVDTGAAITARSGCTQIAVNEVQCSGASDLSIGLGDMDDHAQIPTDLGGVNINVFGGSGDDELEACDTCEASELALYGELGNDTLTAAASTLLAGGRGADVITGGVGRNVIFGGSGDDTIAAGGRPDDILPGLGDDLVDGGPGPDVVVFFDINAPITVNLRTGRATGHGEDELISIRDVVGTFRADLIVGNSEGNELIGLDGDNEILGRGGDDVLHGGPFAQADHLFGGEGNDRLVAGPGDDLLVGGPGRDRLLGRAGDDRFRARDRRADFVQGGFGFDRARIDRRLDDVESVEVVR